MTAEEIHLLARASAASQEAREVEAALAAKGRRLMQDYHAASACSLRALARGLDVDASYLGRIVDGSYPLTLAMAERVYADVSKAFLGNPKAGR